MQGSLHRSTFGLVSPHIRHAYRLAGYNPDSGNATHLRQNPRVQARLLELQQEVAKETKVTVEGLLNELEEARQKASDLDQLSAAAAIRSRHTRLPHIRRKHPASSLELDPTYVDTIIRRWQAFTGDHAVHVASGRLFNDLQNQSGAENVQ